MNIIGVVDGSNGARDSVIYNLLTRLGGNIVTRYAPVPKDTDLLLAWRFRQAEQLEDLLAGGMVMCGLDLGYFDATKFETFSVSINGIHGRSMEIDIGALPARDHPEIRPWSTEGSYIQVCSPGWLHDPTLRAAASEHPVGWLEWAVDRAEAVFGLPAKIRPHPRGLSPDEVKPPPLEDTFEETYVSMSYGSNTAVQTVFAGVPTVLEAPRCVAYPMCAQDVRAYMPRRTEWARKLSHRVYDMQHESYEAADYILEGYKQAKAAGPLDKPLEYYGVRK